MAIVGKTAAQIAASVRALVDTGDLRAGDMLPPSRELAVRLGVNRNTVVSAYRQLAAADIVVTNRGGGTAVAKPPRPIEEGFAPDTVLRDVSSGNPDRRCLPDPTTVHPAPRPPVLYGESTLDAGLAGWAADWFAADLRHPFELTVTGGAVDAIEKLLSQALARGDAVALEDPCFLASINAVRRAGYRPLAVSVDAEGMSPDGLRAALDAGARAVVCTPRAHNPTGVSLTARRARQLRDVLASHPTVLAIEDDHFSMLSTAEYRSIVPAGHGRWALVRSVSKFLGPDLRLAVVASDPGTAERFTTQISPGTNWVSHFVQRTVHAMLVDPVIASTMASARAHYRERNAHFVALLRARGVGATADDGLNVWVDTEPGSSANEVATELLRRGWVARTGDTFALATDAGDARLRFTAHELDDPAAAALAEAVAAAIAAVTGG